MIVWFATFIIGSFSAILCENREYRRGEFVRNIILPELQISKTCWVDSFLNNFVDSLLSIDEISDSNMLIVHIGHNYLKLNGIDFINIEKRQDYSVDSYYSDSLNIGTDLESLKGCFKINGIMCAIGAWGDLNPAIFKKTGEITIKVRYYWPFGDAPHYNWNFFIFPNGKIVQYPLGELFPDVLAPYLYLLDSKEKQK